MRYKTIHLTFKNKRPVLVREKCLKSEIQTLEFGFETTFVAFQPKATNPDIFLCYSPQVHLGVQFSDLHVLLFRGVNIGKMSLFSK